MTFDEKVDKVLERMGRGDRVNIFPIISWHAKEGDGNQQRLIASFMEGKDLIRIDRDGYIIGHFGINILKEYGSWLQYIEKNKKETSQLDFERRANIREKRGWQIAFLTVTIIAAGASVRQCSLSDKMTELDKLNSKQIRQIEKYKADSVDHLRLLETKDKEIKEIDKSLKSFIDSLKVKK